jgi:hypothetical protein
MPISPAQLLAGNNQAVENELMKVASACEGYGYELALLKIAESEEKAKEEAEEKDREDRGESPALSQEEKKEAAAMGLYTFEGFINKLANAGQVMYGDPSAYIRALAIENGSYEKVAGAKEVWEATKGYSRRAGEAIGRGYEHTKNFAKDVGGAYTNGARWTENGGVRGHFVRATAAGLPSAAVGAGAGALMNDDAGEGALYGALAGGLGGAAGGSAFPYARRGAMQGYGKVKGMFSKKDAQ